MVVLRMSSTACLRYNAPPYNAAEHASIVTPSRSATVAPSHAPEMAPPDFPATHRSTRESLASISDASCLR